MTANVKENSDLFWAIRGGGGNFGVVTSFLFRGCPVDQVFAGPMLWEMEHARELLEWYREFALAQPEELYGFFAFLKVQQTGEIIGKVSNEKFLFWISIGQSHRAGRN